MLFHFFHSFFAYKQLLTVKSKIKFYLEIKNELFPQMFIWGTTHLRKQMCETKCHMYTGLAKVLKLQNHRFITKAFSFLNLIIVHSHRLWFELLQP